MLEGVTTKDGTAPLAQIPGYRVAGKTGTAQRVNPRCGCYTGGGYTSTFVGFAPADARSSSSRSCCRNPEGLLRWPGRRTGLQGRHELRAAEPAGAADR